MPETKLTLSLGLREWLTLVGALLAVAGYIVRLETQIQANTAFIVAADTMEVRQNRELRRLDWRYRRLERLHAANMLQGGRP